MYSEYKLVVIIVSDGDADRLIQKLVENSIPATKISSTGGFLQRGTATILSGIEASEVEKVIARARVLLSPGPTGRGQRYAPRHRVSFALKRSLKPPISVSTLDTKTDRK